MAMPGYLGKYGADGSLEHAPEVSPLTNKPLTSGAVTIRFGKALGEKATSPYFVMVNASEWARLTPEERRAMKAKWASELPAAPQAAVAEPPMPAYEAMSFEALKQLAHDRRVNVSGRLSAQALAQALRAADVEARFAQEASDAGEAEPESEVSDAD